MDINELLKKKQSGKVILERKDDMIVIKEKKYDEETGQEKEVVNYLSIKELLIKRKQYQDELEKINNLINGVLSNYIINSYLKQIYGKES